jgi:hypothetical protein
MKNPLMMVVIFVAGVTLGAVEMAQYMAKEIDAQFFCVRR